MGLFEPAQFLFFRPPFESSYKARGRRSIQDLASEFEPPLRLKSGPQTLLPERALEALRRHFAQSLPAHGKDGIQNTETILF